MKKNNRTTNSEQQASDGALSPKGVRLISLYIGSFDSFKGQVMNFCSDYRTEVKNSKVRLRLVVKQEKVLPDNFFALNEGNGGNGCVKSVSAIIGKNGSGKTTLARLFCNLPASDSRKPSWMVVMVYEMNGMIKAYSTFQNVVVETNEGDVIICDSDLSFNWPYRFFYYSPYFTTEQFEVYTNGYHADLQTREEGAVVSDISTTGLMLHPEGNSELLLHRGILQTSIFDTDEKIRLFEFISRYYTENEKFLKGDEVSSSGRHGGHARNPLNKFTIPKPSAISIGIHTEGFLSAVRDMSDKVESCRRDETGVQKQVYSALRSSTEELRDPVGEFLRTLIEPFVQFRESRSKYGLVGNVFMSYAARYIQECGMFNPSFPNEILQRGFLLALKNFIIGGDWTNVEKIKTFLRENPPPQSKVGVGIDAVPHTNPVLELVELLQKFCECSNNQTQNKHPSVRFNNQENVLLCRLDDDTVLKDVCRLVWLHGEARSISSFMKFDVLPHMSSGEMSFLMLFARLYHFVGNVPKNTNVVVFLDEAETTLHPEWQRRLVSYCIRFFEVFLPDRNYHLIFASHSPMLLTDVPKQNAVFLDENNCVVNDRSQKAFAANIFELYKDSFVLKNGQVGAFASSKLRELLGKLQARSKAAISKEDLKLASLIDDPFISRHVWSRLGQMVMDNDMPEDEITEE